MQPSIRDARGPGHRQSSYPQNGQNSQSVPDGSGSSQSGQVWVASFSPVKMRVSVPEGSSSEGSYRRVSPDPSAADCADESPVPPADPVAPPPVDEDPVDEDPLDDEREDRDDEDGEEDDEDGEEDEREDALADRPPVDPPLELLRELEPLERRDGGLYETVHSLSSGTSESASEPEPDEELFSVDSLSVPTAFRPATSSTASVRTAKPASATTNSGSSNPRLSTTAGNGRLAGMRESNMIPRCSAARQKGYGWLK